MSEIFSRNQVGMKTVLMGAGIASIGSKNGVFYVDLRIYEDFSLQPKRTTIEADREMFLRIVDCLPREQGEKVRKVVLDDGNILLIDPVFPLEIPMIHGTVSWSKLLQRPCLIADYVFNPHDDTPCPAVPAR